MANSPSATRPLHPPIACGSLCESQEVRTRSGLMLGGLVLTLGLATALILLAVAAVVAVFASVAIS